MFVALPLFFHVVSKEKSVKLCRPIIPFLFVMIRNLASHQSSRYESSLVPDLFGARPFHEHYL